MSITRLQQARQMYATGQRVAKTLDGSRPGYRGDAAYHSHSSSSVGSNRGTASKSDRGSGPSSSDRAANTREQYSVAPPPDRATNLDVREQYAVNNPTTLGAPIAPPTVSPHLENIRNDNRIDAMNLLNTPYKPVNLPSWVPGSTLINTAGNFIGGMGHGVNTKFFAENVAGKYGYGYGLEDYKQYMKDRMSGKVGAYGNVEQGQNAINARGGDGGGGIMDIYNLVNATDTDTDTEKFKWRFAGNQPTDVVERIEADIPIRFPNLFT